MTTAGVGALGAFFLGVLVTLLVVRRLGSGASLDFVRLTIRTDSKEKRMSTTLEPPTEPQPGGTPVEPVGEPPVEPNEPDEPDDDEDDDDRGMEP